MNAITIKPAFTNVLTVLTAFILFTTLIPYLPLERIGLGESFYTRLNYLSFAMEVTLWVFLALTVKKARQKQWIQVSYWVFIFWQIASFFKLWGLATYHDPYYLMFLYAVIGLPVLLWFAVANFRIRIQGLVLYFCLLGSALLLGALLRLSLPVLAVAFQNADLVKYSGLGRVLPLIVLLMLFVKLRSLLIEAKIA